MKKALAFMFAAILCIATCSAQLYKGDIAAGANLVYGSHIESLGLGAKFQYTIIDHVRAEVGFNYFFKKDFHTMWDANLNAHYLINVYQEKLLLYPIAGLCFASVSFDEKGAMKKWDYVGDDYNDTNRFGLNLGAGAEYLINENIGVTLEYRHTIMKDIDQGVIGVGVNYKF
jgi:outer membrane protein X